MKWLVPIVGSLLFCFAGESNVADSPALRIETMPSPPYANRPFAAEVFFSTPKSPGSFGFVAPAALDGHTLTAHFTFRCAFEPCPGTPADFFGPFPLSIPALNAGEYTLVVIGDLSPPLDMGSVSFSVSAAMAPITTVGPGILVAMCVALGWLGFIAIRRKQVCHGCNDG
jgi:hypothetical protein